MKMLYAGSKDLIKKKLVGITHVIQAAEYSELNKHDVTDRIKNRKCKQQPAHRANAVLD